jgi:hypothetical protein
LKTISIEADVMVKALSLNTEQETAQAVEPAGGCWTRFEVVGESLKFGLVCKLCKRLAAESASPPEN